jgi:nicotianamine synthase
MRESLINLCGRAEGLLELEFATFLIETPQPLNSLHENGVVQPKKVAFVGSGPMPLTSSIMAIHHMKFTHFDNFDVDEAANGVVRQLVVSDAELEKGMKFETCDIVNVKEKLSEYDCIFLAALVGLNKDEKLKILSHLRKYMKEGGILLVN